MIAAGHQSALVALLGADGALFEPAQIRPYGVPARHGAGAPAGVLRPRTTAEVSAAISYCVRNDLAFVPQSANTGLVLGSTPDASGEQLVLSLERLTSVLRVDPLDRTVCASSGVRLSGLNAALAPHQLFLPIDLPADPMLGGMAATNTGGTRFVRYGDMRRHVLGLEVVLADDAGTVLRLSDGLRKDNSALPLRQLFVGSCGALGVITEVTLEVHRRPTLSAAALLTPRQGAALELLDLLEGAAGEALTAVEGMSRAAMAHAFAQTPHLRNPFPRGELPWYAVLIELTRSSAVLEREPTLDDDLEALLAEIAGRPNSPLADALVGPAEPLWAIRQSLSEGLRAAGPVVGFDLAFRRSAIFDFRAAAINWLNADYPEYEVCDFGHLADGALHFNLLRHGGLDADLDRLEGLRRGLLGLAVETFGGSFSAEHGMGRANQDAYDRFIPDSVKSYSAAIAGLFARTPASALRLGPP